MDVLSWRMLEEKPTAASLISQALQTVPAQVLRSSKLTALIVLSGAVALEFESAVAVEVRIDTVWGNVRWGAGHERRPARTY